MREIAKSVKEKTGVEIKTAEVDAMDVAAVVALIKQSGAELLVNLALPYQDLKLMDACLEAGINYLDTANYEPEDEAKFEYHWQWAYQERFKKSRLDCDPRLWLRSGRNFRVRNLAEEAQAGYHPSDRHSRL